MNDPRLRLISKTSRFTSLKVGVFWPDDDDGDAYRMLKKVTSFSEAIKQCEAKAKNGYGVGRSEIHIIDSCGTGEKVYKFIPEGKENES